MITLRHSAARVQAVLTGKYILIVEDEPVIALDLESAVKDQHGFVVGPIDSIVEAIRTAETATLHGAILDLRLRQGLALPVAEVLRRRQIPFVIHSGQAEITIPRSWPDVPTISKPAAPERVITLLAALIDKRQA
jgi:ActR/RegA family two-component response regulator